MRRTPATARRSFITPANVVALIALLLATAGSASAARTISGANIKDSSLTGADFKNGSLQAIDFSMRARASLKGSTGATGATGVQGDKGATGATGPQGPAGAPARVTSKWSWFESRYLRTDQSNNQAGGPGNWTDYDNDPLTSNDNIDAPNVQWINGIDRSYETVLSLNSPNCNVGEVQGVDCPWGANDGGGVTVSWDSNITAVANVTILHSQAGDLAAGHTPVNTRATCYLAANRGTGSSDFDRIGAKTSASGFRDGQIETLQVVGSINRTTDTSTDYMVRVECRDSDGTHGRTRYHVLSGSLSVVATERG